MSQVTPWLPLYGASEMLRRDARALEFPQLYRCRNFYIHPTAFVPTTPIPTFAIPAWPGDLPCAAPSGVLYTSWLTLGSYVILLNAGVGATVGGRLQWTAPNRPGVWDLTELDGDGNTVYTGAGSSIVSGDPVFKWGIGIGALAPLFSETGIGLLMLSDQWVRPFSYQQLTNAIVTATRLAKAENVIYFCGTDGLLRKMSGSMIQEASEWLDASLISEITWPPAADLEIGFSATDGNLVIDASGTQQIWLNRLTGGYGLKDAAQDTYIETGVLRLVPEHHRTHIKAVRARGVTSAADWNLEGKITDINAEETNFDNVALPAGYFEVTMGVNKNAPGPRIRLQPNPAGTGTLQLHGIQVIFEDGGRISY